MRTTIRLNDSLLREAKRYGLETGKTLTAVIEDALREALARRRSVRSASKVRLPSGGSGGLRPGVQLDDSRALRDVMDGL